MKKVRLRHWVLPTFASILLVGILLTYHFIGELVNYSFEPEQEYLTDTIVNETIPVNKEITQEPEIKTKVQKPVNESVVEVSKHFYSQNDSEDQQQKSLIKYSNIYMPNTGILYSSDNEFDIMAVLDGKVSNIKEDEILGKIIEIEHSNNIITIYQSVQKVNVKVGQKVKQGEVIALSGPNKLENEKDNCLHFEVYKEGNLINPEEFYNMEIK